MEPVTESTPDPIRLVTTLQRWKPWLIGGIALLIGLLLADALRGLLAEFGYQSLIDAIRSTPSSALILAAAATAVSYLSLTGYDHSSLRYVGATVPYSVAAQTELIAYALSNTIGLGVLTGGVVRMRFYSAAGIDAGLISRAIAFNAVTFGLGISVVGALALLWGADAVGPALHVSSWILETGAALVIVAAGSLIVLCRDERERLLFGRLRIRLLLALALLVMHELRHGAGTAVSRAAASLAPLLLAAYTVVIGVMLLISGVTQAR